MSRPDETGCPSWCVVPHDQLSDDGSYLHASGPVGLVQRGDLSPAMVSLSATSDREGPQPTHVRIGDDRFLLDDAAQLAALINEAVRLGRSESS